MSPPNARKQMGLISVFFNERRRAAVVTGLEGQNEYGIRYGALVVDFFSTLLSHNLGIILCENTSGRATIGEP